MSFVDNLLDEVTRGARAIVVCPDVRGQTYVLDATERLEETSGLALAIGVVIAASRVVPVRKIRASTLFGSGQVGQILADCELHEAELVIVDGALSAIQQRNLEEQLKRKVIDRTGLILEIFGERAATAEGRMQVECAHLDYQQSRLVRSWTHLERQRGGFGFLGGPGETQIEADRRMIRQRMTRLRKELEQVRRTRSLHRARRGRATWPVIALVGYTNAGKSTLFNRLTGANVMVKDLRFATLDPTMRAVALPGVEKSILSDTVGFISDLPTQLVAAFRATLEEVTGADLIMHVRDMANPAHEAQKKQVLSILADLGVVDKGRNLSNIPIIEAWNKLDLVGPEYVENLHAMAAAQADTAVLSALTGEGVETLLDKVAAMLTTQARVVEVELPVSDGRRIAWLHAHGEVLEECDANEWEQEPMRKLSVRLNSRQLGQFEQL